MKLHLFYMTEIILRLTSMQDKSYTFEEAS